MATRNCKDDLIDAAVRLFAREGFRSTGIDRLLSEAGVAKMTLYKHFENKDDLIAAALEKASLANIAHLESSLKGDGPNRLLSFFDALGEWCSSDDFSGCVMLNAAAEFKDADHPVRLVVRRHAERLHDLLRRLSREAGAADPDEFADQMMLLVEGAIEVAAVSGVGASAATAKKAARTLLDAAA